ncbi:integrase [Pseudomonas fluorescens]|uniref:integrase n=1 Tax=Pseudomonas fluorescens TaxID=294 RepID=UPI0030DCB2F8
MDYVVGESVFLKERDGIFTVLDFDVETDSYLIQSSGKIEPPWKAHRDSLLKISSDISERIRAEVIAHDTQQHLLAEVSKPVSRYDDDQILTARMRERIIKPLYETEKAEKITKTDKEWAMTELKVKLTVLNDLLARYRKWPNWESLVPGKPGRRKGATRFSQEVEDVMVIASQEDPVGPGGTVQAMVNGARARLFDLNQAAPSDATIRRRYKKCVSDREALANNKGSKAARDKFNTFEHGAVTTHALQLIHADNSPLDCHAIDPETGKWLGRPNLTLIVDDHTDSFLGFALSYRAPSRNTLADAMLMAVQPKDALLEEYGLSGTFVWMQYGAGENYRVDGGRDLNAKTVLAGLDKHGITPQRRMRPQSGGKVERGFGKINPLFMQRLNGAIASNRKIARGEDPQAMARYSITDLFILIITQICIWHEWSGGDRLTSNQRWLKSFGVHDGVIKVPRSLADPEHFWIDILHERHVSVRREGILTTELLYTAGPYKNQVGRQVRIKIDHNNIHRAWVEYEGKWVEIALINKGYGNIPKTMWEWDVRRKYGQRRNELTILGLVYVNAQRKLMRTLITDGELRRLEESSALQERALNALSPGLITNSSQSLPSATTEEPRASNAAVTSDGGSVSVQRGPAPPMMGDDDL